MSLPHPTPPLAPRATYDVIDLHTLVAPFMVTNTPDLGVDRYRTLRSAQYAADLLNAGHARVNPHAPLGSRIEETS
jgi:hypothetical protein